MASRLHRIVRATLAVAAVATMLAVPIAAQSGGDGRLFAGTYNGSLFVIDETDLTVRTEIKLPLGIPMGMTPSPDGSRLYVKSPDLEKFDVVDVENEEVVDSFTLQDGNTHIKVWGQVIEPGNKRALFITKAKIVHRDRFEIGPPKLQRVDLESHEVIEEIPWPDDVEREFAQIIYSPDGKHVFFMAEDLIVFDADTFEEVDRWELSRALDEGMGEFNFGFPSGVFPSSGRHQEPGTYTSLFHLKDPVQNRMMMGVATVNLNERDVDFYMLGPSRPISFAIAPDQKKAYGVYHEVGNYQMWTFDLEGRRVESKREFAGRPRMSIMASSNNELVYIYAAGNTIDVYTADEFAPVRTVTYDADMFGFIMVPPAS
ncbi:MAG: hypothetical protein VYE73_13530 [Acidobacteriota bacterium]|nr:hypothetical protein [Acidobacteriota bacterium]